MVTVVMPSVWTKEVIEVDAGSLASVVAGVVEHEPGLARRLLGSEGGLADHVNYAVDGRLVPRTNRSEVVVGDGSVVTVVPPMAGG